MPYRLNAITGELDIVDTSVAIGYIKQIDADAGSALPVADIINLIGTAAQGISSSGAGNTITFTIDDATETQKGVVELATDVESIDGTDSSKAIVPTSLKAKLGTQTDHGVLVGSGDSNAVTALAVGIDGQVLLGDSANDPTFATIASADTSVEFTLGAGTLDLSAVGVDRDNMLYVGKHGDDANDGKTPSKAFLTIQAAETAGTSGDLIYVYPGVYTENVTFTAGIDLNGVDNNKVFITGVHIPPAAGTISVSNISLLSATHGFSSAVAGTATIILRNVLTNCTNGYTFNLPNWGSGDIYTYNVHCVGTNDGFLNNTGDISLIAEDSDLGNGAGNTLIASGELDTKNSEFGATITISGASTSRFVNTKFQRNIDFTVDSAAVLDGCLHDTGATIPISYNSTANIYISKATVNTTNTTAMDGAGTGTVYIGVMDFLDGSSIEDTFTVLYTNSLNTNIHGWNGSFLESSITSVAAAGGVITASVQKEGGGDLTLLTHRGYYHWDTTPADTVTLTAGTDTAPKLNYVYLLGSTKTLTANTTGFPATGHARLATVLCQSAASIQTKGVYKLHAWDDHIAELQNVGHIGHINSWVRHQNATWISGVVQNYTITPQGAAPDNVTIQTTEGTVLQLHENTFPAFANPIDYYTVNDSVAAYNIVTDLNSLLTDSAGGGMDGRYFTLVLWGCISDNGTNCKLFINLPSGSYNSEALVKADSLKYANFAIPSEFTGTGFLISQWNLKHSPAAGGTWTSIDEVDLRGFFPGVSAGTGSAAATEFPDNTFRIFDDGDSTKEIAFQASSITAGNTREMTVQDADGTIAYTDVAHYGTGATSFTDHGLLAGSDTAAITALGVGSTGELLVGATGADPAFGTSADGNFTFTSSTAGATRSLTVTNTEATNAASHAMLDIVTGGLNSGDPYVHFNTSVNEFSFGIDNTSTTDLLKLTTGASPSAGTLFLTIGNNGVKDFIGLLDGGSPGAITDGSIIITDSLSGGAVRISMANTNVDANSSTSYFARVSSNAAGDPYMSFDVYDTAASVTTYSFGIDNSDADKLKITAGNDPSAATAHWINTTAGEITMPLQPAFLATHTVAQDNVTGNGASPTVNFTTEVFDQNADYDGVNTFTAPVTGRYVFHVQIRESGLDATSNSGVMAAVASNRSLGFNTCSPAAMRRVDNILGIGASGEVDMDAADTLHITVNVQGMAGNTVDLPISAERTWFSVRLIG